MCNCDSCDCDVNYFGKHCEKCVVRTLISFHVQYVIRNKFIIKSFVGINYDNMPFF